MYSSVASHEYLIGLGSGDYGDQVKALGTLSRYLSQDAIYGQARHINGWCAATGRDVVYLQKRLSGFYKSNSNRHEYQDPKFPNRTLH